MARATFVKKARKAIKGTDIKAGDSYWWWKFRFGGKHVSKTQPKRSQLTQSNFYSTIYDIEDDMIANATADADLAGVRDEIVGALTDLKDECESSRDNMPESLQESETGQLLQDRVDALESAISEFEDLELDEPDDNLLEDLDEIEREEGETKKDFEKRKETETAEALEEARQAYWDSKLEELQGISIEAP